MELRDIEIDPITGVKKKWYLDDDGTVTVEREEDISGILTLAKSLRAQTPYRYGKNALHFSAVIPNGVIHKWMQEGIDVFDSSPEMTRKVKKKLEGEYKYLKTTDKKIWRPT